MKRYNLVNLRPCDRLVLPKNGLDMVQHHAIYIGNDNEGNRLYIENSVGRGVQVVSESYLFRDGFQLTRVEPFNGNLLQRNEAVKRAMQLLGKAYDLVNFNCEHYANAVQYSKSYSKQINGAFGALLGLVLGIGLIRSDS